MIEASHTSSDRDQLERMKGLINVTRRVHSLLPWVNKKTG